MTTKRLILTGFLMLAGLGCERLSLKSRASSAPPGFAANKQLSLELSTEDLCQYGDYDVIEASLLTNGRSLKLSVEDLGQDRAPLLTKEVKLSDFDKGREIAIDLQRLGQAKDIGIFLCTSASQATKSCAKAAPARFDRTETIAKDGGPDEDSLFYFQFLKLKNDGFEFLDLSRDEGEIVAKLRSLVSEGNPDGRARKIFDRTASLLEKIGSVGIKVGGTSGAPTAQVSLVKHTTKNCATTKSPVRKVNDPRKLQTLNHAKTTQELWKKVPKVDLK